MNRRQWIWLMALAVLTLLVTATSPAFPQEQADPPSAPGESQGQDAQQKPVDDATVEKILRQQEQMLTGARFTYDPQGRRDPFRNLFQPTTSTRTERRPGILGMVVAEIDLSGIVKDGNNGDMALMMGSDNKGYFLRVGDSVYDGTVIAIDPRLGTVTFRQQIDDPRRIKPFRDVVKRLTPLEDEESGDE